MTRTGDRLDRETGTYRRPSYCAAPCTLLVGHGGLCLTLDGVEYSPTVSTPHAHLWSHWVSTDATPWARQGRPLDRHARTDANTPDNLRVWADVYIREATNAYPSLTPQVREAGCKHCDDRGTRYGATVLCIALIDPVSGYVGGVHVSLCGVRHA